MALEFTPVAIPYLLAAIVTSGVAVLLWRNRDRRGAKPFIVDLVGIIILSVCDAALVLTPELSTKLFWWNWRFAAATLMGVGYMFMAVEYTNREHWITYRVGAAVLTIPAVTQFFVWSNADHGLVYGYSLDPVANHVTWSFGPIYWLFVAFIVAYLTVGIALLLQLSRRQRAYGRQIVIIVAGITLVLVGEIVWWLQLVPYDPLPITSVVKSLAFLFGVARFELLDIVPVARNKVIENMRDAVFVVDRTNRIVDANQAGKDLVEEPEPVRKYIDEVFDTAAIGDVADASDAHTEITFEPDGDRKHYDFRISPLFDDSGNQSGRLFVFRDVTRLKRREEELSILNRILRHDINNDMTVIQGRSQLLAEHVDEAGRDHLDAIRYSSEHVVELTENISDLMTAISSDEAVQVEPIHLGTVLETQLRQVRQRFADAEFTLQGDIPEDCYVEANEMLSSVFTNLFNNAIQHNHSSTCRVTVSLAVDDDRVAVTVADNGPGIPPDQREDIFGRGEKGLDSTGTGVGLYLVDTLVAHYGGEITISESELGGASFTIDLRRSEPGATPQTPQSVRED